MIKGKCLYPKTKRLSIDPRIVVTEKLDGSNLGFFNYNGDLLIATRNNVIMLSEIDEQQGLLYKGLYGWLKENGSDLLSKLNPGSGVFGEWIGMGKLKYQDFKYRYYIFAKAKIDEDFNISNLLNDYDLLHYAFVDSVYPEYLDRVPLIGTFNSHIFLSVKKMDELYDKYCDYVERNVEGFVIYIEGSGVIKYVRMKNGKIEPHFDRGPAE